MDHLIQDALQYSRTLSSELPLEPLQPGALLREIIQTYPNLQNADIRLQGEFPPVLGELSTALTTPVPE